MSNDPLELIRTRLEKEPYRQKLGMELLEMAPGYGKVAMTFTPELQNLFGMLHGGATFSLLDEAFQVACNARGSVALALQLSVYYLAPAQPGARLIAEARETQATRKTALYDAVVYQQEDGKRIATGQALAYRKGTPLPFSPQGDLLDP